MYIKCKGFIHYIFHPTIHKGNSQTQELYSSLLEAVPETFEQLSIPRYDLKVT